MTRTQVALLVLIWSRLVLKWLTGVARLQTLTTLSSTEAEFIATVEADKEIAWMHNLLTEMGYSITNQSSTLHIDNCSAISVAKNVEHLDN